MAIGPWQSNVGDHSGNQNTLLSPISSCKPRSSKIAHSCHIFSVGTIQHSISHDALSPLHRLICNQTPPSFSPRKVGTQCSHWINANWTDLVWSPQVWPGLSLLVTTSQAQEWGNYIHHFYFLQQASVRMKRRSWWAHGLTATKRRGWDSDLIWRTQTPHFCCHAASSDQGRCKTWTWDSRWEGPPGDH